MKQFGVGICFGGFFITRKGVSCPICQCQVCQGDVYVAVLWPVILLVFSICSSHNVE
jgi:hypothetical protein